MGEQSGKGKKRKRGWHRGGVESKGWDRASSKLPELEVEPVEPAAPVKLRKGPGGKMLPPKGTG